MKFKNIAIAAAFAAITVGGIAPGIAGAAPSDPFDDLPVYYDPQGGECMYGTPGPARYPDGEMRYSEWCYFKLDGPKSSRAELIQGGRYVCDGTICRHPDSGNVVSDPIAATPGNPRNAISFKCDGTVCHNRDTGQVVPDDWRMKPFGTPPPAPWWSGSFGG